ncbi:MAG: hypothetical protein IK015_07420 [Treponema sp.]|nr:hypothetical protein [Treponema sp.]
MTKKNYDDIIDHKWLGSPKHPRMPLASRAKIFMPFAALRGFEELIEKKKEEVEKKYDKH